MKIRIGTRGSDLALWQANYVAGELRQVGCEVEIQVLKTRGDLIDDVPLQNVEGKAFFTAEIEQALLEERVDVAVHSHKDLPVESPPGLCIAAVPLRGAMAERMLLNPMAQTTGAAFFPLAEGARVGTSSPRRRALIEALRPDIQVLELRGNVPTRVNRLREGHYDAILLAAAGLSRLELDTSDLVTLDLPLGLFVPAPAQGALAIQTRIADREVSELCARVFHYALTSEAIVAERSLLLLAGGGCNLALGAALLQEGAGWRASVFRGPDATDPTREPRWGQATAPEASEAAALALQAAESKCATLVGPLAGLRVEVVGSARKSSRVGSRLEQLGAKVLHREAIRYEALEHPGLSERVAALRPGDGLAVTSARAAKTLAGLCLPEGVLLAAVGPATERALLKVGLQADLVGSRGAQELAAEMQLEEGARVLFPCAQEALPALSKGLAGRGIVLERMEVYRTHATPDLVLDASAGVRVFMSPSAVRACADLEAAQGSSAPQRVALGHSTAAQLASLELEAFWAGEHSSSAEPIEDLVRFLAGRVPQLSASS